MAANGHEWFDEFVAQSKMVENYQVPCPMFHARKTVFDVGGEVEKSTIFIM